MKEAYVSFEIAKLLKEKGFDWGCCSYWCVFPNGDIVHTEYGHFANHNGNETDRFVSRPTQAMACSWLREEHKIDISVTTDDGSWWIKITELENWSCVFNGKVLNSDDIKYAYKGDTSTKEGCYEAALDYVLSYLI